MRRFNSFFERISQLYTGSENNFYFAGLKLKHYLRMKLPEYSSFEEKSNHFKIHYIDTIEDVKSFLTDHKTPKGIYRGINNSSYKIYTSLQRQIITQEIKKFSISDYISEVRKELILKKYFNTFKIFPSKLSIWSYLQHYGAPTPLLDFTYDIRKALYFATEKFDLANFKISNTLSDRFSIFLIENENLDLLNIDGVFESFRKYKNYAVEIFNEYPPDKDFDYDALLAHCDKMFDLNVLGVFLLEQKEEFVEVFNPYNNIRIIAQDGLFINSSFHNYPLEEALKEFFVEATVFHYSPWDDIDSPEADEINEKYQTTLKKNAILQKRLKQNIIHSFEIKKELIPEILKELSITRKDIYPNEEELVWELFSRVK